MKSVYPQRLAVICPTRERVDRAAEMLESYAGTTTLDSILIFVVDSCDPQLGRYKKLFGKYPGISRYIIGSRTNITEIYNNVFNSLPNMPFYSCSNDDFVYQTPGWDRKLIEEIEASGRPGIAYGNDLMGRDLLPTTSVISGEIPRALGWLQMPGLTHLCGDLVYRALGKRIKNLHYMPDVIIEHKHFLNRKADYDNGYARTNSREMYIKDNDAFRHWLKYNFNEDARRISHE